MISAVLLMVFAAAFPVVFAAANFLVDISIFRYFDIPKFRGRRNDILVKIVFDERQKI